MKVVYVFLLVLLPLAMAAVSQYDEDVDKRFSLSELVNMLRELDLSAGCVNVCQTHVNGIWEFLCSGACRIVLGD